MLAPSRDRLRFLLLLCVTLGALGTTAWAGWTGRLTQDSVQALVAAGGPWSPVLFVVIATIAPLVWIPRMMTSIVAGALFGMWLGALLALAGGIGGGLAGYALGHRLGHDFVMRKVGSRGRRLAEFMGRRGFPAIALGRISPVTNCEAISLGSGLLAVPMRVYLPATLVGMAPGSLLYAAFGASVLTEDAAWMTTVSGGVALAMTAGTGYWLWRMWKKDAAASQSA